MRLELTPYTVAAFLLVVAGAGMLAALAHHVAWWARRLLTRAPALGAVVLVALLAVAVYAVTADPCLADRPTLPAIVGTCRTSVLVRLALVVAAAVAGTAAVRAVDARRRPSGTAGGSAR